MRTKAVQAWVTSSRRSTRNKTRLTLPELEAWHRIRLREEFRAGRGDVASFGDYLRLEERLFAELRARLIDDPKAADRYVLGRYRPDSVPCRLALDAPGFLHLQEDGVVKAIRGRTTFAEVLENAPRIQTMRPLGRLMEMHD